MALDISLQPKQKIILDKMRFGRAVVIGAGGGRGAAKSGGADRIELILMGLDPGHTDCLVMRNYDQVRKYHIEPMMRQWPQLEQYFNKSESRLVLPTPNGKPSQLDFSYAESLADVERRFRSGNYRRIIVDQAEQFTEPELREMRKANRSPGTGKSCMLLLHNMGGVGIQALYKWFEKHEYNENENPEDYDFVKVNPWDNVEWSREALTEDGLTAKDYYAWTDAERKSYCGRRSQYGRILTSEDAALVNRDWEGDWNALEGAYFGRVFDRNATMITPTQAGQLIKDWDDRWISQDHGKTHFCSTHWHAMTSASPSEVSKVLGWNIGRPVKLAITYRKMIVSEQTAIEVGRGIVQRTPQAERSRIKRFFLSPDAFGDRDSGHTVADREGQELATYDMPRPEHADNERITGWQLMYELLNNTKAAATGNLIGDVLWLISSDCNEILDFLPMAQRDIKNLDDVVKTDKGNAKMEMDVLDDCRYGLKSYIAPRNKPFAVALQEAVQSTHQKYGPTQANLTYLKMQADKAKKQPFRRQY